MSKRSAPYRQRAYGQTPENTERATAARLALTVARDNLAAPGSAHLHLPGWESCSRWPIPHRCCLDQHSCRRGWHKSHWPIGVLRTCRTLALVGSLQQQSASCSRILCRSASREILISQAQRRALNPLSAHGKQTDTDPATFSGNARPDAPHRSKGYIRRSESQQIQGIRAMWRLVTRPSLSVEKWQGVTRAGLSCLHWLAKRCAGQKAVEPKQATIEMSAGLHDLLLRRQKQGRGLFSEQLPVPLYVYRPHFRPSMLLPVHAYADQRDNPPESSSEGFLDALCLRRAFPGKKSRAPSTCENAYSYTPECSNCPQNISC